MGGVGAYLTKVMRGAASPDPLADAGYRIDEE